GRIPNEDKHRRSGDAEIPGPTMEALLRRLAEAWRGGEPPPPRQLQTAQEGIDVLEAQIEALPRDPCLLAADKARAIASVAGQARQAIVTGALATRLEALEQTWASVSPSVNDTGPRPCRMPPGGGGSGCADVRRSRCYGAGRPRRRSGRRCG